MPCRWSLELGSRSRPASACPATGPPRDPAAVTVPQLGAARESTTIQTRLATLRDFGSPPPAPAWDLHAARSEPLQHVGRLFSVAVLRFRGPAAGVAAPLRGDLEISQPLPAGGDLVGPGQALPSRPSTGTLASLPEGVSVSRDRAGSLSTAVRKAASCVARAACRDSRSPPG